MKIKDMTIAIPLFFEAIAGSVVKFLYLELWDWTYTIFPRRHNIMHVIWVCTRPSISRFWVDLEWRKKNNG